ncbi:hypothetical protein [Paremcibacter congregatus]|uniref:PEP-CTERM protein-sorting domain-containing protein n=1 Tax=Paremcibacter congregatus TaxID=2043170 RepID=A0A2G4YMC0_9PROT|nr:hypothetical protein [Paremcibacter congregatus]PHZ83479.1 hypothetical protein CRD36_18155 [Paremcibacter congregatus]QDE28054.1 hypothetical protein FIV45_12650 [Paremcibacter congregatus]
MISFSAKKIYQVVYIVASTLIWGVASSFAVPVYTVTEITGGDLDVGQINPAGVNDSGQVVGDIYLNDGSTHAFVWGAENGMTDLGVFGGTYSTAIDINNRGQVIGNSTINDSNVGIHPFVWDVINGKSDLGVFGADSANVLGIDDNGKMVISLSGTFGPGDVPVFLYDTITGTHTGINPPLFSLPRTPSIAPQSLNNSSQVTGTIVTGNGGPQTVVIWDEINGRTDLGSLGGRVSWGLDINNNGQITGRSEYLFDNDATHAFIGEETSGLVDIGTLGGTGSVGNAINDNGQVVGWSLTENDKGFAAFLWDDGVMYDLKDLIDVDDPLFGQTFFAFAEDINSFGDIIVRGGNGAYLLTANRSGMIPTVSEPAILILFGLSLFGLGRYRYKLRYV